MSPNIRNSTNLIMLLLVLCLVAISGCEETEDSPETITQLDPSPNEVNNNIETDNTIANFETYTNSIGMEFVLIPTGEFIMGSPEDEYGRYKDEGPAHKVVIEQAYYLGIYEVTQEQWVEVMGSNPSTFQSNDEPVEKVSWNDAQEFIAKLNEMEGTDKYRLPSEAEWEYACRANTTTSYSFGDSATELGDYSWYKDNSNHETHPVGQKKPNLWGLHDMYGNVYEWCQDNYHGSYEGAPIDGSAWEDSSESSRILRGGSYHFDDWGCRSADRSGHSSNIRSVTIGFRLVIEE